MTTERLIQAIHREIDGENTPEESHALMEEIARNPEAARRYEYLKFLSARLAETASLEAPPSLKPAVMRAIEARKATKSARGVAGVFANVFLPKTKFVYGFAAGVACVALVAIGLRLVRLAPVSDAEVSGTIGTSVPPVVFAKVQVSEVNVPQVAGSVSIEQAGRLRVVAMNLIPKTPVSATLTYDPSMLALEGVRTGDAGSLRLSPASVSIRLDGREPQGVVFSLRGETAGPVELTLATEEGKVYSRRLVLDPPKNR